MQKKFIGLILLFFTVFLNPPPLFSAEAPEASEEDIGFALDKELQWLRDESMEELFNLEIDVASTKPEAVSSSVSIVSVIDHDMIKRYNFQSITEALNTIPGFSGTRTYLKRNVPTIRGILQDHYANKVLLMINNVPTWHAITGEANLDRISIYDVERIEVLKGPASVLYGTNAYSGAINIVLKKAEKNRTEFYAGVGDKTAAKGGGNYSYNSDGDFSVFISANGAYEKGHNQAFTDETGESGNIKEYLRGGNLNLFANYKEHSFLLNSFSSDESYLGVVPRYSKGANNNHNSRGILLNYTYLRHFGEKANLQYAITYDRNRRNLSRTRDDSVRADILGYRINNALKSNIVLTDHFNLELGTDYDYRYSNKYRNYNTQTNAIIAENDLKDRRVYEYSFFGQLEFNYDPFKILFGTRSNENEFSGRHLSKRGTVVYALNDRSSLKFFYGESYRAPSLFEMFFITPTQTVFGNSNLEPETSKSYEVAYLTSFNNFFIQITGYHAKYDNKIFRLKRDLTLEDGTVATNVNVYENGSEFAATGVDLELKYQNTDIADAFFNFSYIDGNNGDEAGNSGHYNFKYVPDFTVSTGVGKDIGSLFVSGVVNFMGETKGPLEKIGSEATIDVNLGYSQKKGKYSLLHHLSVKNIADNNVSVPEYVRRKGLNEIPLGYGRRISYTIKVLF